MDSIDEAASTQTVSKRKRTKRQRLLLLGPAPTCRSSSPTTSSTDLSGGCTTEEEEDMANCLILLAQGRSLTSTPKPQEKFTSRRFTEAATTTSGKAGFYVYECKTCNKCFPSFQALGGHRASHKKPKIAIPAAAMSVSDYEKKVNVGHEQQGLDLSMNSSFSKGLMKAKVHECSICGSEFSSGQALGGHMRRHRPASISDVSPEVKKERNILSLDLNLPAPCDDAGDMSPAFAFSGKAMVVFSGPAMVDCHY